MRLSTQNSAFIFQLPSDFIPQEIIRTYQPILEKNWVQYDNVLDYLNSTIKSVDFPGISFKVEEQIMIRGKKRNYKPSINVQDIVTTRELSIVFRSVDSDLNYMLLYDIISKHYLDVENLHVNPFTIQTLDIHRDVIYTVKFFEMIVKSITNKMFDYSQQKLQEREFTMVVNFNFIDVEFNLNQSKVLELGEVPSIVQVI
jgi:hypothetical protein